MAKKSSVQKTASKAAKPAKVEKEVKAPKAAKAEKPAVVKAEKPAKVPKTPMTAEAKEARKEEKKTSAAKAKAEAAAIVADSIWMELQRKHGDQKAMNYDMKNQYEPSTPLNHKILGWGWILSNENDRLEVVFKDGKRVLISNYKK